MAEGGEAGPVSATQKAAFTPKKQETFSFE